MTDASGPVVKKNWGWEGGLTEISDHDQEEKPTIYTAEGRVQSPCDVTSLLEES